MSSQDVPRGWLKMPGMRLRKTQPQLAKLHDEQLPWCNRHHVAVSRCNVGKMKHHRLYFDSAPQVSIRAGKYAEVPLKQLPEWQDPDAHAVRMRRRFQQYPSQAVDMKKRKWKPKASVSMLSSLLPGFSIEPKPTSHSYSFPSWSELASRSVAPTASTPDVFTSEATDSRDLVTSTEILGPSQSEKVPTSIVRQTTTSVVRQDHISQQAPLRQNSHAGLSSSLLHGLPPEKQSQIVLFQEWCQGKYGNMLSLWRKLDKDGNMSLSKAEFLRGLADIKYPGKASLLWSILDNDTTGLISITEFVPVAAFDLAKFKHWADERFGSVLKAFHHFDRDRNGKMTMQEFMRGCLAEDFPAELKGSIQSLFDAIDDSRSIGKATISVDEILFLDVWKCPDYLWISSDEASKNEFRRAITVRHGANYIVSWRKALDKDSTMRVNFPEFTLTCERLVKNGIPQGAPLNGVPALFVAFDPARRGWFSLRDWDERSWTLLAEFRRWAQAKFSKVSECFKAWEQPLGISCGNFKANTRELKMTPDDKEYLFEGLSMQPEAWSEEKGRYAYGTLTRPEIVFLDTWDPDEEQREASAWEEQFRSSTPSDNA